MVFNGINSTQAMGLAVIELLVNLRDQNERLIEIAKAGAK
jgi:hypothetical protein